MIEPGFKPQNDITLSHASSVTTTTTSTTNRRIHRRPHHRILNQLSQCKRSHNFRPSYMRLRASLLRATLGIECILAMTATAMTKTLNDVMCSLEIPPTAFAQTTQIQIR